MSRGTRWAVTVLLIAVTHGVIGSGAGPAIAVPGASALGAQDVEVTAQGAMEAPSVARFLDFSSDGRLVLLGHEDGALTIWDVQEDAPRARREASEESLRFARFLSGDTAAVAVTDDGTVERLSESEEGVLEVVDVQELEASPLAVALDAVRRHLAVATGDDAVEILDLSAGQPLGAVEAPGDLDDLLHLGFDRQGRQLIALTERGEMTAWNPATRETLRRVTLQGEELHGSQTVVHAAGADRNANVLVVALEEAALPQGGLRGRARPDDLERQHQLLVFDWHSGARIKALPMAEGPAHLLQVGPGNDHAAVARENEVTLMDLQAGEAGVSLEPSGEVTALAMSPEDDRLAVASEDGNVTFWSMERQEPVALEDLDDAPPELGGQLSIVGDDKPMVEPESPITLAVLPFDDREGDERMSRLVAELLSTQLANLDHLTLVERLRVDDILDEQQLQEDGITEEDGLELGRLLNADYVLVGSVGASGTTQTVSAGLLRVETGERVAGRQVLCQECQDQDLFDAVHLLGETVAR